MSYKIGKVLKKLEKAGFKVYKDKKSSNWYVVCSSGETHIVQTSWSHLGRKVVVGNEAVDDFIIAKRP